MKELESFLTYLYEKDSGYVYAPLKKKDGRWTKKFYLWPSEKDGLIDWITTSSLEGNVYVSPALYKEKSAKKDSVLHSNVAWIEFDGQEKIEFKNIPEPDVIVQTSSHNHIHCYWKIPKASSQVVEDINRRLTYHLGADFSGWDSTQVLRPPSTTNWKHDLPVVLTKFDPPLIKHVLSQFDSAPNIIKPPSIITYDQLLPVQGIMDRYKFPDELRKMVTIDIAVEPNRSTFLMRAGYLLAGTGCDDIEIVSLLYEIDCRIKKFVGRSDQLLRLSEIAAIAVLQGEEENAVHGYSPLEIINHELDLTWLIPGWLHSNGIMMVSGAPGVGKTQFCLFLGYLLATGEAVFNKEPVSPQTVVFVSLEMDIIELKYIFKHQVQGADSNKIPLWNQNMQIFAPWGENSFVTYESIIKETRPNIIIIDSLSELASDDLKESEARLIMRWVYKMRREYNCAVILIHHNRKATDGNKKPRKLSDLYGSYIFGKLSETVISLWDTEKDSIIEIDAFKVRFGDKNTLVVKRTSNLTFEKVERDATTDRTRIENANPLLSFG